MAAAPVAVSKRLEPQSLKEFRLGKELYRSSAGAVHVAEWKGKKVVLKERRCAELGRKKDVMNEVSLLKRLQHENIVQCLGNFWDGGRALLFLVLEYAPHGDLYQLIQERTFFTEVWIWSAFKQISQGIRHLHRHGCIHRDIKGSNVLIFDKVSPQLKIADLGVSRQLSTNTAFLHTLYGTPLYASPEICRGQPYDEKTDIWSLGVVLYEMIALVPPFQASTIFALAEAITSSTPKPLPKDTSPKLQTLVDKLLSRRPQDRPAIADVFRHFLNEIESPQVIEQHTVALKQDTPAPVVDTEQNFENIEAHQQPIEENSKLPANRRRLEAHLRRQRLHLQRLEASLELRGSTPDLEVKLRDVEAKIQSLATNLGQLSPEQSNENPCPNEQLRLQEDHQRIMSPLPCNQSTVEAYGHLKSERNLHKIAHRSRIQIQDKHKDKVFARVDPQPKSITEDKARPATARPAPIYRPSRADDTQEHDVPYLQKVNHGRQYERRRSPLAAAALLKSPDKGAQEEKAEFKSEANNAQPVVQHHQTPAEIMFSPARRRPKTAAVPKRPSWWPAAAEVVQPTAQNRVSTPPSTTPMLHQNDAKLTKLRSRRRASPLD